MKESSPFLNILVPLRSNRARTILYFIRYQKGPTWNERGSYSGTELLFLRIYPLFRLSLSFSLPFFRRFLWFLSFSYIFMRQPFRTFLSFPRECERAPGMQILAILLYLRGTTLRHGPSNVGLIQNRCATHRSLDQPR